MYFLFNLGNRFQAKRTLPLELVRYLLKHERPLNITLVIKNNTALKNPLIDYKSLWLRLGYRNKFSRSRLRKVSKRDVHFLSRVIEPYFAVMACFGLMTKHARLEIGFSE